MAGLASLQAIKNSMSEPEAETGFQMPSRAELMAMGASLMKGGRNPSNTTSGTFRDIGAALEAGNAAGMKEAATNAAARESRLKRQSADARAVYSANARLAGEFRTLAKEKRTEKRKLRKGIADTADIVANNALEETDYVNGSVGKETSLSELEEIYRTAKLGEAATKEREEKKKTEREAADKERTIYNSQARSIMTDGNSVHQKKFKALRKEYGAGKIPQAPLNDLLGEVSLHKEHKANVKEAKKIVLKSGDKALHKKWKDIVKFSGGIDKITPSVLEEIEDAIAESSVRKEEAEMRGENELGNKLLRQIEYRSKKLINQGKDPNKNEKIKGLMAQLKRRRYGEEAKNYWAQVDMNTGVAMMGTGTPPPTRGTQTDFAVIERTGTQLINQISKSINELTQMDVGFRGNIYEGLTKYAGQWTSALAWPGVVKRRTELRQIANRGLRFMQTELKNRLKESDTRRMLPMFAGLGVGESIPSAVAKMKALLPFIKDTIRGGAQQLGRKPYIDWTAPEIHIAVLNKGLNYELGKSLMNSLYPNMTTEEFTNQLNAHTAKGEK